MKYDTPLEMNDNNAPAKILRRVRPGSTVLELGPASGRMTRYLSEQLACRVSIVERDPDAFQSAMAYASEGFCGDIMQFGWVQQFSGRRFSYILLADVLEHLCDPLAVLKQCRELLEREGELLLSTPNLAHGDVLLSLIRNDFRYHKLGLLDETHIHFFCYHSLMDCCREAGFQVTVEDGTHLPLFGSELGLKREDFDAGLIRMLQLRPLGTVYQFVFALRPLEYALGHGLKPQRLLDPRECGCRAGMYPDTGSGYAEEERIPVAVYPLSPGRMSARLTLPEGVRRVRFDPDEGACILFGVQALSDRGALSPQPLCGFTLGGCMAFPGGDPQLEFVFSGGPVHWITLEWGFYPVEGYALHQLLAATQDRLQEQAVLTMAHEREKATLIEEKQRLQQELFCCQEECGGLRRQKQALEQALQGARAPGFFSRALAPLKRWMKTNPHTALFYQGLLTWRYEGLRAAAKKAAIHYRRRDDKKSFILAQLLSPKERRQQEGYPFAVRVKFSILVPLYNTPPAFLREMLASVQHQTYSGWELCLADGSDPKHGEAGRICRRYAKRDPRIRYQKLDENRGIAENTNACIEMSTGSYLVLLDHDDLLHPAALFYCMRAITEQSADFIYTDEMTFSGDIRHPLTLHFKPDFAIDNLRANNYICHLSAFSRALLDQAGGLNGEMDGSQDYDLILRLTEKAEKIIHIPKILYFWRSHPGSVASGIAAKPYCIEAARRAIDAHLARCGLAGEAQEAPRLTSIYKVNYSLTGEPLISIIIPNRDAPEALERCIHSLYALSTYRHFEVLIAENGSTQPKTRAPYRELLRQHENLHVLVYEGEGFNFPAINNFAARQAQGEYLLFLNNDTEVLSPGWIQEMLMFAQRPDVGAVGAKLYYPDGSIQHAGVVVGLGGTAGHIHHHAGPDNLGYMGRLFYAQNFSAVTAACMLLRRALFFEAGGFDEAFAVAYNDVDLCLRLREKGKLIVFTPFAELRHYESLTRGDDLSAQNAPRFHQEEALFKSRWKEVLERGDPYFNPNFRLDSPDFAIRGAG